MLIFRWWRWWWWQWWWKIILQCLFSTSLPSFHTHYFNETAQDLLDAAAKCHFYLSATSDTVDNFLLLVRSASLGFSDSKFSGSSYPSWFLNSITSQVYSFERLLVIFKIKSQLLYRAHKSLFDQATVHLFSLIFYVTLLYHKFQAFWTTSWSPDMPCSPLLPVITLAFCQLNSHSSLHFTSSKAKCGLVVLCISTLRSLYAPINALSV